MGIRNFDRLALLLATAGAGSCSVSWDDERSPYLEQYTAAHYRELGQRFVRPLTQAEFAARLKDCRVLFLGDHHRDAELHRQMLELIEWICDRGHRPVLGIEAIGTQDNPSLQEFLADGIDMARLRRRVVTRWPRSWLDSPEVDHSFFRALLLQARARELDAFALELTPRLPLRQRDGIIAKNIRRALRLYPDRLIIVVVGHAHLLGEGHLAGRVAAPSLTIAARFSPDLAKAFARHPPMQGPGFLRTETEVLFFPPRVDTD